MNSNVHQRYKTLLNVQDQLQDLNGFKNPHDIKDFVMPAERNELLIRENREDIELRICLKSELLQKIDPLMLPQDFDLSEINDLSVVIEELSHFNMYCLRALEKRPVSALELEVRAEIDKFGIFLEWLHQKNEEHLRESVFNQLFGNFKLGSWIPRNEKYRYQEAHQIAKNFCKGVLRNKLSHDEFKAQCRSFFFQPASSKLSPKH